MSLDGLATPNSRGAPADQLRLPRKKSQKAHPDVLNRPPIQWSCTLDQPAELLGAFDLAWEWEHGRVVIVLNRK